MSSLEQNIFGISTNESNNKNELLNSILERQVTLDVKYLSRDGYIHDGQIMVDKDLEDDIKELFKYIQEINNTAETNEQKFYIHSLIPIQDSKFNGDDIKSMDADNSSGFNFRTIEGKKSFSLHAFGFAIDINPKENPVITPNEENQPLDSKRNLEDYNTLSERNEFSALIDKKETMTPGQKIVEFLKNRGFVWGGNWESFQDYHHFEKVLPTKQYTEYYASVILPNPEITDNDVVKRFKVLFNNIKTDEHLENFEELVRKLSLCDNRASAYEKTIEEFNISLGDHKLEKLNKS